MNIVLKKTFSILLILLFITNLKAQETIKKYADSKISTVTYKMSHPMHDWEGVNKNVKAVIIKNKDGKIDKVAVALKIIDFDSKNANRDSHAVEILDAIKYPAVTFVSSKITEIDNNIKVSGILTFHNVKKSITIPVIRKVKGEKEFYSGMFEIDMTEYNIKRPSLMSVPADKIIKISFFVVF